MVMKYLPNILEDKRINHFIILYNNYWSMEEYRKLREFSQSAFRFPILLNIQVYLLLKLKNEKNEKSKDARVF